MSLNHTIPYDIYAFTAPAATIATVTTGVAPVAEVQTITVDAAGGTFTITYDGQTTSALAYDISAADMETALDALSNIADGDVEVTGWPWDAGGNTPYTLTWLASLGATVATPTTDDALLTGGAGTAVVAVTTPWVTGVQEVQTIQITGGGGTFTITFSGQTTSALPYGSSAATVQAALWALSNIADNDVIVTLSGTTYTLTWLATLGNVATPTATVTATNALVGRWLADGFRNIVCTVLPNTTPSYKLYFMKSDQVAEPDFAAPVSATNLIEYVEVIDLNDGSAIDGTTGVTISATTLRSFEWNNNTAKWVGIIVNTYATGNLTGNVLMSMNQ